MKKATVSMKERQK